MSHQVSVVLLVAVVLVSCAAGHPNIFSDGHNDTTSIEAEFEESKIEDIESDEMVCDEEHDEEEWDNIRTLAMEKLSELKQLVERQRGEEERNVVKRDSGYHHDHDHGYHDDDNVVVRCKHSYTGWQLIVECRYSVEGSRSYSSHRFRYGEWRFISDH